MNLLIDFTINNNNYNYKNHRNKLANNTCNTLTKISNYNLNNTNQASNRERIMQN